MRASEHRALGDAGTGAATVRLAAGEADDGLHLTFGDVVALSADYFVAEDRVPPGDEDHPSEDLARGGLFELASVPGDDGTRLGTRDEIVVALKVMAADQMSVDPRFEVGGEFADVRFDSDHVKEVERRVRDRFLALGASNDDHFVRPGPRAAATAADRPRARHPSAPVAYRLLHERALDEAHRTGRGGGDPALAMAREAAAQHHLTDAFAAGHLRTPVAAIREYWQQRYPGFWNGLRRRVAADTTAALKQRAGPLALLPGRFLEQRALAAVYERTAAYPRITLGDLLAKVFHDWDNVHGVALEGGGIVFGDGCLDQGLTRDLAVAAVRAGVDDVEVALGLGRTAPGLGGGSLYAAVREATGAEGELFRAEALIPRPASDHPAPNWRAPDLDSLWDVPIVGSSGTTVGEAVCEALRPGEELPRRLAGLGDGLADSIGLDRMPFRGRIGRAAGEAYQRGFVARLVRDPRAAVQAVIDAGEEPRSPEGARWDDPVRPSLV